MSKIDKYEKKYPDHLVVMQNKILQAFHEMTLDEKRLIVLASPIARTIDASEKDAITITAQDFANACNIKQQSAYKQLEIASNLMMKRHFSYKNESGKRVNVQWIIRSVYDDGAISLCFTEEVLFMLKVFNADNPFTKYEKKEVLKLKRDYSIDLYHIFKKRQHEHIGQEKNTFVISLEDIRAELGLPKSYNRINNLKNFVIELSLNEINEKTDITVSYENVKKGRAVVGFKFTVKDKPKPKEDNKKDAVKDKNGDLFTIQNLSNAQLGRIARNPAFMSDYNHLISPTSPANGSLSAWEFEMVNRLKKDPKQFNKRPLNDYLEY